MILKPIAEMLTRIDVMLYVTDEKNQELSLDVFKFLFKICKDVIDMKDLTSDQRTNVCDTFLECYKKVIDIESRARPEISEKLNERYGLIKEVIEKYSDFKLAQGGDNKLRHLIKAGRLFTIY